MQWVILALALAGVYYYVRGAVRFVDRRSSELIARTRKNFPDLYADYSDEYIRKNSLESSDLYPQAALWPVFTVFHSMKNALQAQPAVRHWLEELTLERLEQRLVGGWERLRDRHRREGRGPDSSGPARPGGD